MTDKEQIIINGRGCRYKAWDKDCALTGDNHGDNMEPCKFIDEKNCYYKQLLRKEQELIDYKKQFKADTKEMENYQNEITRHLESIEYWHHQAKAKEQECEELKIKLIQKDEVDMFFNTPIEGWSNDPCGICPHKAENEELKKEIINKNEKIKELRFSVSDLTNRLCYLNAEKSFRIVDLEQALNEIEKYQKRNCETCSFYKTDKCGISCQTFVILDIINKTKGE